MSFDPDQFRALITRVLQALQLHSPDAVELLMGTAAQESHLGRYLRQIRGPASGVFQMEPATEKDIWRNYLAYRPARADLAWKVTGVNAPTPLHLQGNLIYQITMARLHYRRIPAPLPPRQNLSAMAHYWNTHYNRNPEKGHPHEFTENYRIYCTK
jgi:hypothetical protein